MKNLVRSPIMEYDHLTPDTTFPYRLFRFAHKRTLDSVSLSYFAVVSKDNHPVGLVLSIDINERWHHARQAATNFWQIFVREFNHSESRSTLIRFEESLKELNKAVIKTQEKVKQTISVVAVVLEGNQIHFSTIGTSRVLLLRTGKVNDVTTGSTRSGNQFAAVTSGDLDVNDTLLIANQNLYEFTAAEPDDFWENNTVDELTKKILSRTQNSKQALNCVIIKYSPDDTIQTTLYWEDSEKHYPINLPKFSLPKIPKLSLPKISFSKIKGILSKVKKIKPIKFKPSHLLRAIKPIYIYIVAIVMAVGFGVSALTSRDNSPQNNPDEVTPVVERFSNTTANEQINFLLALAEAGGIKNLTPEETTRLIEVAANNNIIVVIPTGKISELPENIVSISAFNGLAYLLDETGQLWQIGINDQLKQIDHLIKISNPLSLVAYGEASLVANDTLGNIWYYNGDSAGPTTLPLPANLSQGKKLIAKYLNNLYIFSEDKNAIYRQTNFGGKITTNSPYSGVTSLGDSKVWSWAINGDFIFLTNRSNILGMLRDKITVNPFTAPYATANSKITSEKELIAIKDRQLLTVYNVNGSLLWQKFYLTDEKITDVSLTGNTLWFTIGNEVYRQAI